ncbi:competence protein CoiA family protein [Bacillus massiliglaciei]
MLPESLTEQKKTGLKEENFYCPCCNHSLILKAGSTKIPHFAHKSNFDCSAFSEPESIYHLKGKRVLYNWFRKFGYKTEMEAFLPEIGRRADLLVTAGTARYAIEFQCSVIPEAKFQERTKAYRSIGIHPLWILSAKDLKEKRQYEYSVSDFQWLFVYGTMKHPYLLFHCPERKLFFCLKNLTPFSPRHVICECTSAPLSMLHPSKMVPSLSKNLPFLHQWRAKRHRWMLYGSRFASPSNPFHSALYNCRLVPAYLPLEIGIPVAGMFFIKTPAIEWQGWLYMDLFARKCIGRTITEKEAAASYLRRMKNGDIRVREFPLIIDPDIYVPLYEYLHFLEEAGYLSRLGKGIYKIEKRFTVLMDFEEYKKLEELFYTKHKWVIE